MDTAEITEILRTADASIRDVHHVHVWQLASGSRMATLHAEVHEDGQSAQALKVIKDVLNDRFGIQHATVQIDPGPCPDQPLGCAGHGHR
jgi:cobalt-zinc-cadmium efflux system protein